MTQPDRLIGGRYRIVRKIAEGGMGAVYEAQHNLSKKAVALKILFEHIGRDENARQRFLREVSAPAQIGHDGIVEVYDAGFDTEDGSLFVAMEFLQGEPLRDRLARGGHSVEQIVAWFEESLDPLAAAHEAGIVHRDLKPENIFVQTKRDGTECLKILDFGIARDLDSSSTNVTHTGIAMGTPHYMAPEQAMSAKGVTAAADIWAMGVMLYEALAGKTPFDGETASAIVVNACTRAHTPLSQLAPSVAPTLAAFVDRCLDKEPTARPQNAREMLAGLRQARAGLGPTQHVSPTGAGPAQAQTGVPAGPYGAVTPAPTAGGWGPPGTPPPTGAGSAPGYGTSAPGAPGFGTSAPGAPGFGTSAPGYGTSAPGFGPSSNLGRSAPSGGGGKPILLAAIIVLGLGVFGVLAAIVAMVAFGGEDEPETAETAEVLVHTDIPTGEFVVDGTSLGAIVPEQRFALEAGTHQLEIREAGTTVAQGSVTVTIGQNTEVTLNRTVPVNNAGSMVPGPAQTFSGQLRPGDELSPDGKYVDRYPMQWPAGSNVQVFVDSTDFDTYLTLISPSGMRTDNDDRPGGGLNSGLTMSLQETGTWTILVTSFSANQTGDYTVTVRGP